MFRRLMTIWLALGATAFAQQNAAPQNAGQQNADWTRPFPPFHIIGNIYWVGSYDLSTYLITTPQGNILINTGVGDTAQQIKASVEQLGFKIGDTKILTATHGHFDHVAGMAALKKMTGAKLMISENDKDLLESGGKTDFRFGDTASARFEPVKVDQTFKDEVYDQIRQKGILLHLDVDKVPPNNDLRLAVQDGRTGMVGTITAKTP